MSKRNQMFYLISGTSGSGKSTFLMYLISIYTSLNPHRKILVINPQQEKQWSEWGFHWTKLRDFLNKDRNNKLWQYHLPKKIEKDKKIKVESNKDLVTRTFINFSFTYTKKRFKGLLLCDDASSYISSWQKDEIISDLINMRGQNDMDMIFVYHGLNIVPKYILNSADGTNILFYNSAIDEGMKIDKASQLNFNAQMVVNYLIQSGNEHIYARVNNKSKKVSYEKINIMQDGNINPEKPIIIFNKEEILDNYFNYMGIKGNINLY